MRIAIEGDFDPSSSYGIVNSRLATSLSALGHEVSAVAFDLSQSRLRSLLEELSPVRINTTTGLERSDVRVRQTWPPYWTRRNDNEKLIVIQPWEFGSIPASWIQGVQQADAIWVPSLYSKKGYLQSGIDADKVHVVPNGVEDEAFMPTIAKPLRHETVLAFVGGSISRKGVDVLVRAVDNLPDALLERVRIIVKETGYDTYYRGQSLLKTSLDEHPRVGERTTVESGHLSRSELYSLIRNSDALIHPYRAEGFGLPVLESMALGTPVFHTQGGATNEFCRPTESILIPASMTVLGESTVTSFGSYDHAYWLEPQPDALSQLIEEFMSDPRILADLAQRALVQAANYKWSEIAQVAQESLERVFAGQPARDSTTALTADLAGFNPTSQAHVLSLSRRLLDLGDTVSALTLIDHATRLPIFFDKTLLVKARTLLASKVASNPDLWSAGPFRDAIATLASSETTLHRSMRDSGSNREAMDSMNSRLAEYFGSSESVLDIGCGDGSMLRRLRIMGKKTQGIEIDQHNAQELLNEGFKVHQANVPGDLASLDFDPFDGVFLGHLVERLAPVDLNRLLQWIYDHIEDGGIVVIQTPNFQLPEVQGSHFWLDPANVRPYPLELLKTMLSRLGFLPVEGACRAIPEIAPLDVLAVARIPHRRTGLSTQISPSVRPKLVLHYGIFEGTSGFARSSETLFDVDKLAANGVQVLKVNLRASERGDILVPHSIPALQPDIAILDAPIDWVKVLAHRIHAPMRIVRTTFEAVPLPHQHQSLLNAFDEVWTLSDYDRGIFVSGGVPVSKVVTVPISINLSATVNLDRHARHTGHDEINFLSIFEFHSRKNPKALIVAFAKLIEEGIKARLILRPSGVSELEFRRWCHELLGTTASVLVQPQLEVIGRTLTNEEVNSLYARSDVFVLPTRGEGFGMPFLEALCAGLPVIAPDRGGHRLFCDASNSLLIDTQPAVVTTDDTPWDIFKGTAWLDVDAGQLTAAMANMATDPELCTRLSQGTERVREWAASEGVRLAGTDRLLQVTQTI